MSPGITPPHAVTTLQPIRPGPEADVPGRAAEPQSPTPADPSPRRFLFVTMPAGPFATHLAATLRSHGAVVRRLILNGGDRADWRGPGGVRPPRGLRFTDWLEGWLRAQGITDVVTLGDISSYAAEALECARRLGLRRHVIEQGYLRPDWITLEAEGVNARSTLPRSPAFYGALRLKPLPPTRRVGVIAPYHARNILRHYGAMLLLGPAFRGYVYPHSASIVRQAAGYALRLARSAAARPGRARRMQRLLADGRPFFVLFLQREGDSQLLVHSDLKTNAAVLDHVIASFARAAGGDRRLVVKNHPWDPALSDLGRLTRRIARRHGVADRVSFLDGGPFTPLARRGVGVVAVNSTAALSALGLGVATKLLGRAFFDMKGLTHHGPLDGFWRAPQAPDPQLFARFRQHLLETTQIAGNFHTPGQLPEVAARLAERMLEAG